MDAVIAVFTPSVVEYPTLEINFAQLRIGNILRSNIETNNGTVLVVAGTQITPTLIERLKNFAEVSGIKEPISVENSG